MPTKKATVKKPTKKATAKKSTVKKASTTKKATVKKPATKKTAPKKAAPKKTAKKTTKTTATKKPAKDLLYASDEQSFWVTNGEILNSLVALHDAFDAMPKEVFEFHATGTQNDFSVWVETVLCDADCAAALAKAKTQKSAKSAVGKHLKLYVQ